MATLNLENHVLDYYTPEELQLECIAASYNNQISYSAALHLVEGGCFLVYYDDITAYLHSLGSDKRYSDSHNWEIYKKEVARAVLRIIKKLG